MVFHHSNRKATDIGILTVLTWLPKTFFHNYAFWGMSALTRSAPIHNLPNHTVWRWLQTGRWIPTLSFVLAYELPLKWFKQHTTWGFPFMKTANFQEVQSEDCKLTSEPRTGMVCVPAFWLPTRSVVPFPGACYYLGVPYITQECFLE